MKYCFVGLNPGAMTKYPVGVAWALGKRDPEAAFTFVYDTPQPPKGIDFPVGSAFRPRGKPTAPVIRELVAAVDPDVLITTAQRLPDSAFVSAARNAGIFTVMFQHGLYLPFMRREASLFFKKAAKTAAYVRYAAAIADLHSQSRGRYVRELAEVFIFGRPYAAARIDHDRLNVDLVLLNGEYWRAFHTQQYRYDPRSQVVVGYPDYSQLPEIESQDVLNGVCYVAQTLVEHGRLATSTFRLFLKELGEALDGRRLIVKLHPASDLALYDGIQKLPNVTLSRDSLPRATHYVGHYSTYLSMVPFLSSNLYLWEFDGHSIPESIRPAASVVGSDRATLATFLRSTAPHEPALSDIAAWEHFFYRGDGLAFEAAAEEIIGRIR